MCLAWHTRRKVLSALALHEAASGRSLGESGCSNLPDSLTWIVHQARSKRRSLGSGAARGIRGPSDLVDMMLWCLLSHGSILRGCPNAIEF